MAAGQDEYGAGVEAVIGPDQRAALSLAHAQRNAAYHRDQHNPGTLRLVAAMQFEAVLGLWPAVTSELILGGLEPKSRLGGLSRYGVQPVDQHGLRQALSLRVTAAQVAAELTKVVDLQLTGIKGHLGQDLFDRADLARGVIRDLLDEGMEEERLLFVLRNSEFWDRFGADPEMLELSAKSDHWRRRDEADEHGRFPAYIEAEMDEANHQRNLRYMALSRQFEPQARPEVVAETMNGASDLLELETLAPVLDRYAELDRRLRRLERYLPDVVRSWGEYIDMRIEAREEKGW